MAARRAFDGYGTTTLADRIALLDRIIEVYGRRMADLASTITQEMGALTSLATTAQAPSDLVHLTAAVDALRAVEFEGRIDTTTVVHEPVGVCAFITPWNWPSIRSPRRLRPRWPQAARWC